MSSPKAGDPGRPIVRMENAHLRYGPAEPWAVDDFFLDVGKGEILTLLGTSIPGARVVSIRPPGEALHRAALVMLDGTAR